MITIVAVGKKHDDWVIDGIERYQKRLQQPFNVEWQLLPHSSLEGTSARQEESERIHKRLQDDQFVILLDELGRGLNSIDLSRVLEDKLAHSARIVFIIGGAYGVGESIHRRADKVISLSNLVFPHQLVRLILIEQLYRAQEIARGGKYHHV
jgi:23S rRNA (pseudouridine1915-N3)-methyltransferase